MNVQKSVVYHSIQTTVPWILDRTTNNSNPKDTPKWNAKHHRSPLQHQARPSNHSTTKPTICSWICWISTGSAVRSLKPFSSQWCTPPWVNVSRVVNSDEVRRTGYDFERLFNGIRPVWGIVCAVWCHWSPGVDFTIDKCDSVRWDEEISNLVYNSYVRQLGHGELFTRRECL